MPDETKRRKQIDSAVEDAVKGKDKPKEDPKLAEARARVERQPKGSARRRLAEMELERLRNNQTTDSNN